MKKNILAILVGILVGAFSLVLAQVTPYSTFDWLKVRQHVTLDTGVYFDKMRIGTGSTFSNIGVVGADELGVEGAMEVDGAAYFNGAVDIGETLAVDTLKDSGDGEITVSGTDLLLTQDLWIEDSTGADSIRIYDNGTNALYNSDNPAIIQVAATAEITITGSAVTIADATTITGDVHVDGNDLWVTDSGGADSIQISDDGSNAIWDGDNPSLFKVDGTTVLEVAAALVTASQDVHVDGMDLWVTDGTGADSIQINDDGSNAILDGDNPVEVRYQGTAGINVGALGVLDIPVKATVDTLEDSGDGWISINDILVLIAGADLFIEDDTGADSIQISDDGSNAVFDADNPINIDIDGTTVFGIAAALVTSSQDLHVDGMDLWITDTGGGDSLRIYDDGDTTRITSDNPIKIGNATARVVAIYDVLVLPLHTIVTGDSVIGTMIFDAADSLLKIFDGTVWDSVSIDA